MFANFAQETGTGSWTGGLYHLEEGFCRGGANANACKNAYNHESWSYPPVDGEIYYGRGPLQISHNYNYGQFGYEYLQDPDMVLASGEDAFKSALWFWTTPQGPKPSMHDQSVKDERFGKLTNIINGGIECGPDGHSDHAEAREEKYNDFRAAFGL